MSIWVVKCRDTPADGSRGWHWAEYFESDEDPYRFGGEEWINSNQSMAHIRDDVSEGDLVVCYQSDDRDILGLTCMASGGMEEIPGSGRFNRFDLIASRDSIAFPVSFTVDRLRENGCDPACFKAGTQGTIFPVTDQEYEGILKASVRYYQVFLEFWSNPTP